MYSIDYFEGDLTIYNTTKGCDPVLNIIKNFNDLEEAQAWVTKHRNTYKNSYLMDCAEEDTTRSRVHDAPSESAFDYSLETDSELSFHDLLGIDTQAAYAQDY